jgi:hypothetical protein
MMQWTKPLCVPNKNKGQPKSRPLFGRKRSAPRERSSA